MPRFAAHLSLLFTEVPLPERFERAARAGFDAVEMWFPYEHTAEDLARWAREAGVQCLGLNAPAGDASRGDSGLAAQPGREAEFRDAMAQALDYAQVLGCRHVHAMAGTAADATLDGEAGRTYLHNLVWAADEAARRGKTVLIEPLNPVDRPGYYLSRQSQAREVIERVARPNLRLLFDIYHVQMTEGRITHWLQAQRDLIGHIQLADVPGRHQPGTGEIRFEHVLREVDAIGYDGWVGCEYVPQGSSEASLAWRDGLRG